MDSSATRTLPQQPLPKAGGFRLNRSLAFGTILIIALLAFELFNYITTDYALSDFLGKQTFAGLRWSTILALAFCAIDFAGIARLFSTDAGSSPTHEVWYLFGAWMLAATMNAMLTWWGVSMALLDHSIQSTAVLNPDLLLKIVPVFVAILVWVIRVLLIGSLSYASERFFATPTRSYTTTSVSRPHAMAVRPTGGHAPAHMASNPVRQPDRANIPNMARPAMHAAPKPEPSYHNIEHL